MSEQRPEWMPNEWIVRHAMSAFIDREEVLKETGLRAQIAALESLPVRFNKAASGSTYLDRFVVLKIAALRKELGQ